MGRAWAWARSLLVVAAVTEAAEKASEGGDDNDDSKNYENCTKGAIGIMVGRRLIGNSGGINLNRLLLLLWLGLKRHVLVFFFSN